MTIAAPKRLSYSSLSMYAECGERWRLSRGYKLDNATWYATLAGTAIHTITELLDAQELGFWDGPIPSFKEAFDREIKNATRQGRKIKASGRQLKEVGKTGGPNKKDYWWWLQFGPERVQRWVEWKKTNGLTLITIEEGGVEVPAVELYVQAEVAGEQVIGYIDRVYANQDGEVVLIDLKNGEAPKGVLQLATYRLLLLETYGIDATWGAFWMSDSGDLALETNLTTYSPSYVAELYEQARRGIEAGVFLPNVTSMCKGCGVREFCRAVGGESSVSVPLYETVRTVTTIN